MAAPPQTPQTPQMPEVASADDKCCICLNHPDIGNDDAKLQGPATTPKITAHCCGNTMHVACALQWHETLDAKGKPWSCPYCRQGLAGTKATGNISSSSSSSSSSSGSGSGSASTTINRTAASSKKNKKKLLLPPVGPPACSCERLGLTTHWCGYDDR